MSGHFVEQLRCRKDVTVPGVAGDNDIPTEDVLVWNGIEDGAGGYNLVTLGVHVHQVTLDVDIAKVRALDDPAVNLLPLFRRGGIGARFEDERVGIVVGDDVVV